MRKRRAGYLVPLLRSHLGVTSLLIWLRTVSAPLPLCRTSAPGTEQRAFAVRCSLFSCDLANTCRKGVSWSHRAPFDLLALEYCEIRK